MIEGSFLPVFSASLSLSARFHLSTFSPVGQNEYALRLRGLRAVSRSGR
jgi:hypothetical protein